MKLSHAFNSVLYLITRKQDPVSSLRDHDAYYRTPEAAQREQEGHDAFDRDDHMSVIGYTRVAAQLKKQKKLPSVAVDIGCGTGYFSSKFSKDFKQVIGIEPSPSALRMAQGFYPKSKFKNISWKNGFAQDVLATLPLNKPTFFFTGVVLSHLDNDVVEKICAQVSRAPKGSVILFCECFGETSHHYMWHTRSKEWWQEQLPGYEFDWYGEQVQVAGRYKNFWAIKK